jgi:hypothetical protein
MYGIFSHTFLQEAISKTSTHDLMVTRQQLYRCARAPFLVENRADERKADTMHGNLSLFQQELFYTLDSLITLAKEIWLYCDVITGYK